MDKNIPIFFSTDERRVKQVFINILSNAVKFSKKGNILLKVEVIHRK